MFRSFMFNRLVKQNAKTVVANARDEMPGISAFELAVRCVHYQWPGLLPEGLAIFQQAILKEVCDSYSIPPQDRAEFGECVYGGFKHEL